MTVQKYGIIRFVVLLLTIRQIFFAHIIKNVDFIIGFKWLKVPPLTCFNVWSIDFFNRQGKIDYTSVVEETLPTFVT